MFQKQNPKLLVKAAVAAEVGLVAVVAGLVAAVAAVAAEVGLVAVVAAATEIKVSFLPKFKTQQKASKFGVFAILRLVISAFLLTPIFCFAQIQKTIVFIGDSLTEGYGVSREESFVGLVDQKISNLKLNWKVINSGVSGSTTASAVKRIKWQLNSQPDIIVLALGANDGLRGLDIKAMEKNLTEAIEIIQKPEIPKNQSKKIKLILAGMKVPPNYGKKYSQDFAQAFSRLGQKPGVIFIPFLLEGVAGEVKLNQADGIHPNEKGHQLIAEMLWKVLKDQL